MIIVAFSGTDLPTVYQVVDGSAAQEAGLEAGDTIRKINGATTRDILRVFTGNIFKLSLIMAVLASVGAFFVAQKWLQQFAEKVSLNPLFFICGSLLVLVIVLVVVVLNCLRIAHANPVESLKNE